MAAESEEQVLARIERERQAVAGIQDVWAETTEQHTTTDAELDALRSIEEHAVLRSYALNEDLFDAIETVLADHPIEGRSTPESAARGIENLRALWLRDRLSISFPEVPALTALRDEVDRDWESIWCVDCGVEVDGLGPPICREC